MAFLFPMQLFTIFFPLLVPALHHVVRHGTHITHHFHHHFFHITILLTAFICSSLTFSFHTVLICLSLTKFFFCNFSFPFCIFTGRNRTGQFSLSCCVQILTCSQNLLIRHMLMSLYPFSFRLLLLLSHTQGIIKFLLTFFHSTVRSPIFQFCIQTLHGLQAFHLRLLSSFRQVIGKQDLVILQFQFLLFKVQICPTVILPALQSLVKTLFFQFILCLNHFQLMGKFHHFQLLLTTQSSFFIFSSICQLHQFYSKALFIRTFLNLKFQNFHFFLS